MRRWLEVHSVLVVSLMVVVGGGGCDPAVDDDAADDDAADDDDGDDDTGDDDVGDDDTGDDDTGDDDTGDDDTVPVFDCATVPANPISETIISGPRAYHGLAFDDVGNIVGNDTQVLIQSTYQGKWSVYVPGVGYLEQMAYLPNGDLVFSSGENGGLHRVDPSGVVSLIAADVWSYGVRIGPDGMIYADRDWMEVVRVDPATGVVTTLVASLPNGDEPHSLDFNRDFTRLYIGTLAWGKNGTVYYVDLDGNLDPTGPPQVFATNVGEGWHDGVGVDACGYVYVPDYWTSRLFRISPGGKVQVYANWNSNESHYGHGLVWGSGFGGWRDDAIYMPMPYGNNQVNELVLGVPYRTWPGKVINAP